MDNFGEKIKIYYFGLINPTNKKQKKFYTSLKRIGYIVHPVGLKKRGGKYIQKSLDVELVVNAMQILPSLKKFVLISGDGDFAPLLKQAINYGIDVSIIALPFTMGYFLKEVSHGTFFNIETLIEKNVKKLSKIKKSKKDELLLLDNLYIEKGDSYNSYMRIRNLMASAKSSITIIDSYIDDQILTMIKLLKPKISVVIFTEKIEPADFCVQVRKLKDEGRLITIHKTNIFHDRFIGIDNSFWHSGYSFKDLGKRDSMFNKIIDKLLLDKLKTRIEEEYKNSKEICK